MDNISKVSDERKLEVLKRSFSIIVVDNLDSTKRLHFNCGSDLPFFLSFVDWSVYHVEIIGSSVIPDPDFSNLGISPAK